MESKDDDVVRFSDLIKGVAKKDVREKNETPDDVKKQEDGPLRFSGIDVLRFRGKPASRGSAVSEESTARPERSGADERKVVPPPDSSLNDLEEYKRIKAEAMRKSISTAPVRDPDPGPLRKDEAVRSSELAVPADRILRQTVETEDKKNMKILPEDAKEKPRKTDSISIDIPSVDAGGLYDEARYYLETVKGKVVANQHFEIHQARSIVEKMIESRDRIEALYLLTTKTVEEEDYNISHQTNVAIYAIKLGFGLGYSGEKRLEIGLCALLHDTGMFRISDSIKLKRQKLTGQETDIIKTHPDIGRDILNAFSKTYPFLSVVAYEHHEREGGQGYPRGLQGDDIHEYARIVAITDSYEAMTHHRPYRKALLQPLSAKELIKQKNALFAPFVIKAFLQEISLYPPGSYVILNNKAVAEVVSNDKNHPLRPDVKILFDGEGNKVYNDIVIKLAQNPLFFIVDGISPEAIPGGKSK